jgi:GWxTD domain-containing protein
LRRYLALCLTVLLALTLSSVDAKRNKKDNGPNLKKWIDGPIRYITKKHESAAFRALEKDQDRILFIERFWAARDPYPETMTNEYRQLFWDRVREANDTFLDAPVEGWRTDRGKIHVLYGPPNEIQEDGNYRSDATTSIGGIIRWIYDGRVGGRSDVNPITVVPFVRGAGGEYKVSYDPKLSSVFWITNNLSDEGDGAVERWMELVGAPGRSELSVMLDLGKMQEVPPQAQIMLERVETAEAFITHGLEIRVDRFDDPNSSAEWLVSLSVDISYTTGRSTPAVIGRVRPADTFDDGERGMRVLDEASFKVEEDGDKRVAQARIRLAPGEYQLTVMAADSDTSQTGLQRQNFRLPARSDRMHLSDVIPALQLESLRYAALSSYDEPFTLGPFRVIPRFDARYTPGQSVQIFYEVYGGLLPLRVNYQVQGREEDGRWVDLGGPSSSEQEHHSQAWALPTSERWPLGPYRIKIEVYDADGKLVTREVPFELIDPSEVQSSDELPPPSDDSKRAK